MSVRLDIWEPKLSRELDKKAKAEGFNDSKEVAEFLIREGLRKGLKKTYESRQDWQGRPTLKPGDKVRLTKRARNQVWVPRNVTMVVVKVGTTVMNPRHHSEPTRYDPHNGYCTIVVAYKHRNKWKKARVHRKNLYKIG